MEGKETPPEHAALRLLLSNYVSLGHTELARLVAARLRLSDPSALHRIAVDLLKAGVPRNWLQTVSAPSGAQLAWHLVVEAFEEDGVPDGGAGVAEAAAGPADRTARALHLADADVQLLTSLIGQPSSTELDEEVGALVSSLPAAALTPEEAAQLRELFAAERAALLQQGSGDSRAKSSSSSSSSNSEGSSDDGSSDDEDGTDKASVGEHEQRLLSRLAGSQPHLAAALLEEMHKLAAAAAAATATAGTGADDGDPASSTRGGSRALLLGLNSAQIERTRELATAATTTIATTTTAVAPTTGPATAGAEASVDEALAAALRALRLLRSPDPRLSTQLGSAARQIAAAAMQVEGQQQQHSHDHRHHQQQQVEGQQQQRPLQRLVEVSVATGSPAVMSAIQVAYASALQQYQAVGVAVDAAPADHDWPVRLALAAPSSSSSPTSYPSGGGGGAQPKVEQEEGVEQQQQLPPAFLLCAALHGRHLLGSLLEAAARAAERGDWAAAHTLLVHLASCGAADGDTNGETNLNVGGRSGSDLRALAVVMAWDRLEDRPPAQRYSARRELCARLLLPTTMPLPAAGSRSPPHHQHQQQQQHGQQESGSGSGSGDGGADTAPDFQPDLPVLLAQQLSYRTYVAERVAGAAAGGADGKPQIADAVVQRLRRQSLARVLHELRAVAGRRDDATSPSLSPPPPSPPSNAGAAASVADVIDDSLAASLLLGQPPDLLGDAAHAEHDQQLWRLAAGVRSACALFEAMHHLDRVPYQLRGQLAAGQVAARAHLTALTEQVEALHSAACPLLTSSSSPSSFTSASSSSSSTSAYALAWLLSLVSCMLQSDPCTIGGGSSVDGGSGSGGGSNGSLGDQLDRCASAVMSAGPGSPGRAAQAGGQQQEPVRGFVLGLLRQLLGLLAHCSAPAVGKQQQQDQDQEVAEVEEARPELEQAAAVGLAEASAALMLRVHRACEEDLWRLEEVLPACKPEPEWMGTQGGGGGLAHGSCGEWGWCASLRALQCPPASLVHMAACQGQLHVAQRAARRYDALRQQGPGGSGGGSSRIGGGGGRDDDDGDDWGDLSGEGIDLAVWLQAQVRALGEEEEEEEAAQQQQGSKAQQVQQQVQQQQQQQQAGESVKNGSLRGGPGTGGAAPLLDFSTCPVGGGDGKPQLCAAQRCAMCLEAAAVMLAPGRGGGRAAAALIDQAAVLLPAVEEEEQQRQQQDGTAEVAQEENAVLRVLLRGVGTDLLRRLRQLLQELGSNEALRSAVVGTAFLPWAEDAGGAAGSGGGRGGASGPSGQPPALPGPGSPTAATATAGGGPVPLPPHTRSQAALLRRDQQDKAKALSRLAESYASARRGKQRYLSSVLHNLAKVLVTRRGDVAPAAAAGRCGGMDLVAAGFSPGLDALGPAAATTTATPGPAAPALLLDAPPSPGRPQLLLDSVGSSGGGVGSSSSGAGLLLGSGADVGGGGDDGSSSGGGSPTGAGAPGYDSMEGVLTPRLLPGDPLLRPHNYLAAMLSYIAQVGDQLTLLDRGPSETFNYFNILDEQPRCLLPRLVLEQGDVGIAFTIASLMGTDLIREVLRACLPHILPPPPPPPPLRQRPGRQRKHEAAGQEPNKQEQKLDPRQQQEQEQGQHNQGQQQRQDQEQQEQQHVPPPSQLLVGYSSPQQQQQGEEAEARRHLAQSTVLGPPQAGGSGSGREYTLQLAVLRSLADSSPLRSGLATVFAILHRLDARQQQQQQQGGAIDSGDASPSLGNRASSGAGVNASPSLGNRAGSGAGAASAGSGATSGGVGSGDGSAGGGGCDDDACGSGVLLAPEEVEMLRFAAGVAAPPSPSSSPSSSTRYPVMARWLDSLFGQLDAQLPLGFTSASTTPHGSVPHSEQQQQPQRVSSGGSTRSRGSSRDGVQAGSGDGGDAAALSPFHVAAATPFPAPSSSLPPSASAPPAAAKHFLVQPASSPAPRALLEPLLRQGRAVDAVAAADHLYADGAPDWVLARAVEQVVAAASGVGIGVGGAAGGGGGDVGGASGGAGTQAVQQRRQQLLAGGGGASAAERAGSGEVPPPGAAESWEWCLRISDRALAARLSLRAWNLWELRPCAEGLELLRQQLTRLQQQQQRQGHETKQQRVGQETRQLPGGGDSAQHLTAAAAAADGGASGGSGGGDGDYNDELASLISQLSERLDLLDLCGRVVESPAGQEFRHWTQVQRLYQHDPVQLIRRLLTGGAASAATLVARRRGVSGVAVAQEAHAAHCRELLRLPRSRGGSVSRVLRYLGELRPQDASATALMLAATIPDPQQRQVIVRFLMRAHAPLSAADAQQLQAVETGLAALGLLPGVWRQRCSQLMAAPGLMLETLLINQQTKLARAVVEALPQLHDDALVRRYAAAALEFDPHASLGQVPSPPVPLGAPGTGGSNAAAGIGNRLSAGSAAGVGAGASSGPGGTARFALNNPSAAAALAAGGDAARGGGGSAAEAMPSSPSVADVYAAASGASEDPGLLPANVRVLTGDPATDSEIRQRHRYYSAPSLPLFRALLSLSSTRASAARGAAQAAEALASSCLVVPTDSLYRSVPLLYRTLEAAMLAGAALEYAREQMAAHLDSCPGDADAERDLRAMASLLSRVQLQAMLLSNLVPCGLQEVAGHLHPVAGVGTGGGGGGGGGGGQADVLLGRLLEAEHYALAVYTAKRCGLPEQPLWEAWAVALVRIGDYDGAKAKLSHALQPPPPHPSLAASTSTTSTSTRPSATPAAASTTVSASAPGAGIGGSSSAGASQQQPPPRLQPAPAPALEVSALSAAASAQPASTSSLAAVRQAALRVASALEASHRPVDVEALAKLHAVLRDAALEEGRDPLDGDEFLRVLQLPGKALAERLRRSAAAAGGLGGDAGGGAAAPAAPPQQVWDLARSLLEEHAPDRLLPFLFRHGRYAEAFELMLPSGEGEEEEGEEQGGGAAAAGGPAQAAAGGAAGHVVATKPSEGRYGPLDTLFQLCWQYAHLDALTSALNDARSPNRVPRMLEACEWLQRAGCLTHLCRLQLLLGMYDAAGHTRIAASRQATDIEAAVAHLEAAGGHFNYALAVLQRQQGLGLGWAAGSVGSGLSRLTQPSGGRGGGGDRDELDDGSVEEGAEEPDKVERAGGGPRPGRGGVGVRSSVQDLAGCVTKCALQVQVYRTALTAATAGKRGRRAAEAAAALSPAAYSLFAAAPPPGASAPPPEAAAALESRRLALLELLLRHDFGLGFRVIYEFGLPPVRVYSSAAGSMASGREHQGLADLLRDIEGVVTDEEYDQVLAAGVAGYSASGNCASWEYTQGFAGGLGNPAQRLVELMRGVQARVAAYLSIGLLNKAAEEAFGASDVAGVQAVQRAALQCGDHRLVQECTRFLDHAFGRAPQQPC